MGDEQQAHNSDAFGGSYSFVAQYMTLALPDRILVRLKENRDYDDLDDTKLYTSYRHEFQHFVQNITTSYGLWKTLVLRVAGASFLSGTELAKEAGVQLRVPYDDNIKVRRSSDTRKLPEHEQAFGLGRMLVNGVKGLEGGHKVPDGYAFPRIASPRGGTNPQIESGGVSTNVTASTLLEYQAYTQQLSGLWNTRGIPTQHAQLLGARIAEYPSFRVPQNIVAWGFRGTAENTADLNYVTFELVTLALSPRFPEPAAYALLLERSGQDSGPKIPWEHIHPGWRLLAIAETIRDRNLAFPKRGELPALIANIADSLAWPDAVSTRHELLAHLEGDHLGKLMIGDLLACRAEVDKIVDARPAESINHLYRCLGNETLRALLRGPSPRYDDVNMLPLHAEIATQLYYGGSSRCPLCFLSPHRSECSLNKD